MCYSLHLLFPEKNMNIKLCENTFLTSLTENMTHSSQNGIKIIKKPQHRQKFTKVEDQILVSLVSQFAMNDSTMTNCFEQITAINQQNSNQLPFPCSIDNITNNTNDANASNDNNINQIQNFSGINNLSDVARVDWNEVSKRMIHRTPKQCRDHYVNFLLPCYSKQPFTEEEDALIKIKHYELGPKWTKMTIFLPGRSPNSIKNRWNYYISREGICKNEKNHQDNKDDTVKEQKSKENFLLSIFDDFSSEQAVLSNSFFMNDFGLF
ncbi:hypothetical protein TRFO_10382 [Tritrichomonas foetus]|uniref:Myb-like DNA-binding domain containing protein n=1 Tax=Tritrichomonas foetus TaxID=1144522 RepID=A0A1J4J967_9EUKA|nr:hypothetical protein TRFO_10382 [Tritrichomonas foetus]|eukprot:OHS95730.1 hypothetical protein TRFO_10382 [Tritrichomonas foetus]